MTIAVLGSGAWGTALATMLASGDEDVVLWGRDATAVDSINRDRMNPVYLNNIKLSETLQATTELTQACQADTILCVTPAQTFVELAGSINPHVRNDVSVVLCAKGIDRQSGRLLHDLAAETFGSDAVSALSGPSFASDVARGLPTAVSLAASSMEEATRLAELLSRPRFRIYATDDLIGVEIGGALKNVLALAVGIARGLQLGASAEAALIARGFAELSRVAEAQGTRHQTLVGLSGLGDLVLTCSSPQSRNFSYGMALARGENLTDRPLAEGVHSADMALNIANQSGIEVPIIQAVVDVLSGELEPAMAVNRLLDRPLKGEV